MPDITKAGPIWTLDLGADENRFTPDWLEAVDAALEQIATTDEPAALVTVGTGKFYSNGLDLDWLATHRDRTGAYVNEIERLLARLVTLPVPTVAALNGHAFGAGAVLAMAHDYRVMRADRGYLCFPEVDIRIPFTAGMSAVVTSKLTPRAAIDAMTTGHRYAATEAVAAGLIDATAPVDAVRATAASLVRELAGKDRRTLGAIKSTMFASVVDALRVPARERRPASRPLGADDGQA